MTCLRLAAAALTLLALPALAQPALQASPNNRIGFVNTERVLRDSAPAIRAQTKLKAEFQKREDEIARLEEQLKRQQVELEKNAVAMNESQRRVRERDLGELNRDYQRKLRELREDSNQRRNEELAQVIDHANRVIRQIAEQEKYDIIFQDAVYASPRIDITDRVIKALEGKPPAK
ncbi:MAG TPA: OmpH family outer membrane protein [Burkholderiales bacterium]